MSPSKSIEWDRLRALLEAYLKADFFGGSPRRQAGSALTTGALSRHRSPSARGPTLHGASAVRAPRGGAHLRGHAHGPGARPRGVRIVAIGRRPPRRPPRDACHGGAARALHAATYVVLGTSAAAIPITTYVGVALGSVSAGIATYLAALQQTLVLAALAAGLEGCLARSALGLRARPLVSFLLGVLLVAALLAGVRPMPELRRAIRDAGTLLLGFPPAWFAGSPRDRGRRLRDPKPTIRAPLLALLGSAGPSRSDSWEAPAARVRRGVAAPVVSPPPRRRAVCCRRRAGHLRLHPRHDLPRKRARSPGRADLCVPRGAAGRRRRRRGSQGKGPLRPRPPLRGERLPPRRGFVAIALEPCAGALALRHRADRAPGAPAVGGLQGGDRGPGPPLWLALVVTDAVIRGPATAALHAPIVGIVGWLVLDRAVAQLPDPFPFGRERERLGGDAGERGHRLGRRAHDSWFSRGVARHVDSRGARRDRHRSRVARAPAADSVAAGRAMTPTLPAPRAPRAPG